MGDAVKLSLSGVVRPDEEGEKRVPFQEQRRWRYQELQGPEFCMEVPKTQVQVQVSEITFKLFNPGRRAGAARRLARAQVGW